MNVIVVIQADMAASPLPCKEMLSLRGLPAIDWTVYRASRSTLATGIAVTAPPSEINDALRHHLENQGIAIHENRHDDIPGLLSIARSENADALVLVGANQPFVWGEGIDCLIRFLDKSEHPRLTYAYNHIPVSNAWPAGLGGEIAAVCALEVIASETKHNTRAGGEESGNPSPETVFNLVKLSRTVRMATFDPADERLRNPEMDLRLNTPADYRKLALMLVHPDMHPAEIIQRYPRYGT